MEEYVNRKGPRDTDAVIVCVRLLAPAPVDDGNKLGCKWDAWLWVHFTFGGACENGLCYRSLVVSMKLA